MPCTGVKASVEVRPPVAPPDGPARFASSAMRLFVWFATLVCLAAMRSLPEPCPLASVPIPSSSSPNVSSATPNVTRFACTRISVTCVRSRCLRARAPPRLRDVLPSGMGNALATLNARGSCHLSSLPKISSRNFAPTELSTSPPAERKPSTRAASVHRPERRRATLVRSAGGVPWRSAQPMMCPVCANCPPDASPPSVRRLTPSDCTTPAGSPASFVSPPAVPISRAATSAPTMVVRLGATACIRVSTYACSCALQSASSTACRHWSIVLARASAGSGAPDVVDAVTVTTITVAAGTMPASSTAVRSASSPILSTTRA
mmetsp:Transcript_17851/g.55555  ORF Transcript_17851/g.55555 Transcript_17851/m.55555 type:complete len:319 (+) Transcript_17851:175-1131(+)